MILLKIFQLISTNQDRWKEFAFWGYSKEEGESSEPFFIFKKYEDLDEENESSLNELIKDEDDEEPSDDVSQMGKDFTTFTPIWKREFSQLLFEQIRYELHSVDIDETKKNMGAITPLKELASMSKSEYNFSLNVGFANSR